MLGNVTAAEVRKKIEDGDQRCKGVQEAITAAAKERAREERLEVRRKWATEKKKLQALLDVLEIE